MSPSCAPVVGEVTGPVRGVYLLTLDREQVRQSWGTLVVTWGEAARIVSPFHFRVPSTVCLLSLPFGLWFSSGAGRRHVPGSGGEHDEPCDE